jgi:hypothetical protein
MVKPGSQRKSFDWTKFALFLKRFLLPRPKIYLNIYELRPELDLYTVNNDMKSRVRTILTGWRGAHLLDYI